MDEILKWHCVNAELILPGKFRWSYVTQLGKLPLRCSRCAINSRSRQMYRLKRLERTQNFCGYCIYKEARVFLSGTPGLFNDYGMSQSEKIRLLTSLLSRTTWPEGIVGLCLGHLADTYYL